MDKNQNSHACINSSGGHIDTSFDNWYRYLSILDLNSDQYLTKIIDHWIANKQKCQSCGLIVINNFKYWTIKIGENKINLKIFLQNFCKDTPEFYSGRYNASVVVYLPPLFPCLLSLFPVSVSSAPALFPCFLASFPCFLACWPCFLASFPCCLASCL